MLAADNIYVIYGDQPARMVPEALERVDLAAEMDPAMQVGLKPNLVVPQPAALGATTSAELIEGLLAYLHDHGIHRIRILESSGVGHDTTRAFRVTGLERLAARFGVQLIDLKRSAWETIGAGTFQTRVFTEALRQDFLINLPVVKAHCQTGITCALKNLKGLIPDSEKRRYHAQGLHEPIARLNQVIRPQCIIADGMQGDLTFEEGGTPVAMDRILIAKDPVLLDSFVATALGYPIEEIRHLCLAEALGVGVGLRAPEQVVELNPCRVPGRPFVRSRALAHLAEKIDARQACSTCYGGLLHALARLDRGRNLKRLPSLLQIGQGFRNIRAAGVGIGDCTRGLDLSLAGCPPRALDIRHFLETLLARPEKGANRAAGQRTAGQSRSPTKTAL